MSVTTVEPTLMQGFYTVPQIARMLETSISKVNYAALKYRIDPVSRFGHVRVYDKAGLAAIRQATARNR